MPGSIRFGGPERPGRTRFRFPSGKLGADYSSEPPARKRYFETGFSCFWCCCAYDMCRYMVLPSK